MENLGETTGTSITLDDDGGGYGWFIDSTPQDNSEFLPYRAPRPLSRDSSYKSL